MIDRPFRDGLPVRLIATPRDQLLTCTENETVGEVSRRNEDDFDHIPVVDDQDGIIGCFTPSVAHQEHVEVSKVMQPLRGNATVGDECDIVTFIEGLPKQGYWFTVGRDGISGFVTWSDIQKLPARVALFALVTQLELLMIERIRSYWSGDSWMELLSAGRREKTERKLSEARQRDSLIEALHYTDFCDKRDLLRNRYGGKPFVDSMKKIERLRNSLAHASNYADGKQSAHKVAKLVVQASSIIDMIASDVREDRKQASSP